MCFLALHITSLWLPNIQFQWLFLPEKLQNEYNCFYKHDDLVAEHVASSNNIHHFLKFVIFNKFSLGVLA